MTKTRFTKILSVLLCLALVVAIALTVVGCTKKNEEPSTTAAPVTQAASAAEEVTKLGEGEKVFTFVAKDYDGNETKFEISSNASKLGEALLEQKLIAGDESEYGLFVKTVNGKTYDGSDKVYWMLYIDGEMAPTGVDSTDLVAGKTYSFIAEKSNY
ncbi:MAG: DUF4430 domain-containing protein [Clostridia bacterium]|nr:DUF4430 domain-containing protein [Clostridia bacterium]